MKTLTHIIVLSCRKATMLIEKSQTGRINPIRRLQLYFHLKMCDGCLRYQKQSSFVENLLKNDHDTLSKISNLELSLKSKDFIQKAIEEKFKKK